ncbi:MAG TPA: hypothetical protein VFP72_10080 [Kineosporiaceae bacterium]|nr:hypothetical protein [Kineosporiaceae bacterium]
MDASAARTDRNRGTQLPAPLRAGAVILAITAAGAGTAWLLGRAAAAVSGNRQAPWIVGRASGITAYLLLLLVVMMGLVLAHPWRARLRRPSTVSRIRLHVVLTAFTLAFTVLHVVVLATDHYAGVGWRGALLPLGASFRPVPVTLGVIGLYAGLLAGATAVLAGRLPARIWWPLHKVSGLALLLVWVHGLTAGSDTPALLGLYAGGGLLVLLLAVSRYVATTPADRLEALASASQAAADRSRSALRAVR